MRFGSAIRKFVSFSHFVASTCITVHVFHSCRERQICHIFTVAPAEEFWQAMQKVRKIKFFKFFMTELYYQLSLRHLPNYADEPSSGVIWG